MSPPMPSTSNAMSVAERSAVPLNSRCSRKCDAPASASGSSRPPTPTHTAIVVLGPPGTASVTTRSPPGSTVLRTCDAGGGMTTARVVARSSSWRPGVTTSGRSPAPALPAAVAVAAAPPAASPARPHGCGTEVAEGLDELGVEVLVEVQLDALARVVGAALRVGGGVAAGIGASRFAGVALTRFWGGRADEAQRDLPVRVDVVDPHRDRVAQ